MKRGPSIGHRYRTACRDHCGPARPSDAFYRNKTVNLLVRSSEGGGFDRSVPR